MPPTKLEIEGLLHLSEEDRKDVFRQLAVNLGAFCEHVHNRYKLDPQKIEIEVELGIITPEKSYEA